MSDADSDSDDDLWEIKPVTPSAKRDKPRATNHDRTSVSGPHGNDENKERNGTRQQPPHASSARLEDPSKLTAVSPGQPHTRSTSRTRRGQSPVDTSDFEESPDSSADAFINTPHRPFWKVSTTSNSNLLSPVTTPKSDRRSANSPSSEDDERQSSAHSDRTTERRDHPQVSDTQTASVPIDARTLNKWTHMKRELIHRVGMDEHHRKFVMQYMPDVSRPYYRMYLPQETQFQLDNFLYCRKKRKKDKFRLSLSEKMTKKGNALYEGKLTMISGNETERAFRLTDRHGRILAELNTIVWPEAHRIDVLICPQDAESPKDAKPIELVGFLQPHIDPRLTLKLNGEPVFEILHPSDHESQAARNRVSHRSHPTRSSRARLAATPRARTDSGGGGAGAKQRSARAASVPSVQNNPALEDCDGKRSGGKRASDRSKRLAQKRTRSYQGNRQNKYLLEWKSPLSMFTSFGIACVAEDCIQAEAKNGGHGSYFVDGKKGSG